MTSQTSTAIKKTENDIFVSKYHYCCNGTDRDKHQHQRIGNIAVSVLYGGQQHPHADCQCRFRNLYGAQPEGRLCFATVGKNIEVHGNLLPDGHFCGCHLCSCPNDGCNRLSNDASARFHAVSSPDLSDARFNIIHFFGGGPPSERKYRLFALTPTILYAAVAVTLNIAKVMDGPYPFLHVYEQPVYMSIIWFAAILGGAYFMAWLLLKANKKCSIKLPLSQQTR